MKIANKKVFALVATAIMAPITAPAFAGSPGIGATITYGPLGGPEGATAVPTLSGGLLLALAVLMLLVAVRVLKSRRQGASLAVAVTTVAALAAAGGGVQLIADAQAAEVVRLLEMNNTGGGTLLVPEGASEVFNATPATPLRIQSINYSFGCMQEPTVIDEDPEPGFVGVCETGTTLAPDNAEYCTISVICDLIPV